MSNEELLARTDKLAQYNAVLQQRLLEHFESNSVARVAVKSREPTTEVTTATTTTVTPTSNTGLAAAVAPLFNSQILAPTVTGAQPNIETEPNCHEDIPLATSTTTTSSVKPGCSNWFDDTEINKTPSTPQKSTFSVASPQQIMPFPATRKISRVVRKRGKTAIITSSPYKNELEESIKKKKLAEEEKQKKKAMRDLTKTGKKTAANKKKVAKKKKGSKYVPSIDSSDSEVENTPCLFCNGCCLESNEGWAACSSCGKWAHCSCGIDDEDEDATFSCKFCQQK
ncbi:hypothetical protein ACJJTC_016512 [Scirpophaga incertulas]